MRRDESPVYRALVQLLVGVEQKHAGVDAYARKARELLNSGAGARLARNEMLEGRNAS